MALYNWFKPGGDDKDGIKVVKLPEEDIGIGEMAAAHPAGAAASIKRMMEQTNGPAKILVAGDGRYSKRLRDYSLKMAQRHDCEIIALNVSEDSLPAGVAGACPGTGPLQPPPVNHMEQFIEQSQIMGVNVVPVMQTGSQQKAIAQLTAQDPTIRYVLTEPDYAQEKGISDIPFLDLAYPHNDI